MDSRLLLDFSSIDTAGENVEEVVDQVGSQDARQFSYGRGTSSKFHYQLRAWDEFMIILAYHWYHRQLEAQAGHLAGFLRPK